MMKNISNTLKAAFTFMGIILCSFGSYGHGISFSNSSSKPFGLQLVVINKPTSSLPAPCTADLFPSNTRLNQHVYYRNNWNPFSNQKRSVITKNSTQTTYSSPKNKPQAYNTLPTQSTSRNNFSTILQLILIPYLNQL